MPVGRRLLLIAAAMPLLPAVAAGALPLERLGDAGAWHRCTLDGESRPAASCAELRLLASHKGRRVPASGTLEIRLPAGAVSGNVLVVAEAYTYAPGPLDRMTRTFLRHLPRGLGAARSNGALRALFGHDARFRAAPQPPAGVTAGLPPSVTLWFRPEDRGRRVAFGVWAWSVPAALSVRLPPRPLQPGERLQLAFGVEDAAWQAERGPVTFVLAAVGGDGVAPLWRRTLDPTGRAADRGWQMDQVDLSAEAGRTVELVLSTEAAVAPEAGLATWARPAVLAPAAARPPPPNLVLLSIDTLRADHVTAYGHRRPTTPTLDRVAAEGVLFEQTVAPFPSTTASHMTMLTSLEPCAHGILVPGARVLAADAPTVTELLAARGYATAAVTEDGLIKGDLGFDRGFDSYRDMPVGTIAGPEPMGVFDRGIAFTRRWLERHGGQPFFLFLHTYQVHVPFKVPPQYRDLFPVPPDAADAARQESQYDEGLRYADDLVAEFLQVLAALPTPVMLIVTADHGIEFGEHGGIGHARGVYEEQVRVPLILRHPTLAHGGRRSRAHVGLIDLAPTLLDLAGVPAPASFAGRSLVPLLAGDVAGDEERVLFAEQLWGKRQTLLRTPRRAWVQKESGIELYDLAGDPWQHHDLAADEPAAAADGARRIAEFRARCAAQSQALKTGHGAAPLDPERTKALRALGYVQ